MSPPAPIDVGLNGDSTVMRTPLTVDGVAALRAKQPKMSLAVAASSDSDMFKSPVSGFYLRLFFFCRNANGTELMIYCMQAAFAQPKAKRWDRTCIRPPIRSSFVFANL